MLKPSNWSVKPSEATNKHHKSTYPHLLMEKWFREKTYLSVMCTHIWVQGCRGLLLQHTVGPVVSGIGSVVARTSEYYG